MLMPQICVSSSSPTYLIFHKPCLHGSSYPPFRVLSRPPFPNQRNQRSVRYGCSGGFKVKAVAVSELEKKLVKVKATITVQPTVGGIFSEMAIERGLDDIRDLLGKSILLELVSAALDPKTSLEKETIKGYAHRTEQTSQEVKYEAELEVPTTFGEIGAIFVENEHHREMFIKDVVLDGFETGPVHISCSSWVHSKYDNPVKRVFFTNKSYLPSETPEGLRRLRGEELEHLRGNGQGERQSSERIYDYDVYNDLGDPDNDDELQRPVLGGKEHPYPRRCRTGRPRCKTGVLKG